MPATTRSTGDTRRRPAHLALIAVLVGGAVVGPSAAPASAAPALPGAVVTIGNGGTLLDGVRIELTTAHQLTVRCTYTSNRIIAFTPEAPTAGVVLPVPCDELRSLYLVGTGEADTVSLDLHRTNLQARTLSVRLDLGGGNDVGRVTAAGNAYIYLAGGDGDDDLRAGLDGRVEHSGDFTRITLEGEEGDDVLRHDGYTTGTSGPAAGAPQPLAFVVGGHGADQVLGPDDDMSTYFSVDLADTRIRWSPVIFVAAFEASANTEPTVIRFRAEDTTIKEGAQRLWIPPRAKGVSYFDHFGPREITVQGKSATTSAYEITAWRGSNLTLRPYLPATWDPEWRTVTQPGAKGWYYFGEFGKITYRPL